MCRLLAVFLFLLQIRDVIPANCTTGYTDIGNGICQSTRHAPAPQYKAYTSCAADNGYMSTINNAFDNSHVAGLAGSNNAIWLGLTCTSSQKISCLWDNGVSITNSSYTNFYPGHPNVDIGACVYLNTANGQWYSSDCTRSSMVYICQISPGVYVPQCPIPTSYFRGHCYYPLYALGYEKALVSCLNNCGNLASIHSDGENSYVRDIALSNSTNTIYSYIGLTYNNGSYQWDDGTQMNYDKFGLKNSQLGSCVIVATTSGDIVPQNHWMSADCLEDITSVCKTDLTCLTPTYSPPQCGETQYLSGDGEILSPGYPLGSDPTHCQYIITVNSDSSVVFSVQELALDSASTIQIYNSPTDTVPFAIFNSSNTPRNDTQYFSATNFVKIIYDTPTNNVFNGFRNRWRLIYNSHPTDVNHCGGTFATSPSVISGQHFGQNCTYVLQMGATANRTCLRFSLVDVRPGDTIAIYDGPVSPGNQIGFLASTVPNAHISKVALCSTTTNNLTVVTTGNSGLNYQIFVLTAADSPAVLNPPGISSSFNYKPVPLSDTVSYQNSGTIGIGYYTNDNAKRVQGAFSNFYTRDPNYIVILDGVSGSTVAFAYGSLSNTARRIYYSGVSRYLGVLSVFPPDGGRGTAYSGSFTAI